MLVANHPNSLLDAAMVAAAARRPVQFLAKAPLLVDPRIGWLVRGSGAIPVYRAVDDAGSVHRNDEAFRAAHTALADGAALGIFPEGVSHHNPSLVQLKTGAARIALGAAHLHGSAFPIVPVGLTLRGKEHFRSDALALVGEPVIWDDLAARGTGAPQVKELTRRIEAALVALTLNLERWEDAPLVEAAEAIYAAEFGGAAGPRQRVAALGEVTQVLKHLRHSERREWIELAEEISDHTQSLDMLGLRPADLRSRPTAAQVLRWSARQLTFFAIAGAVAMVGTVVFYLPYRATDAAVSRLETTPDLRATYRTLGGALFFALWILVIALVTGLVAGLASGLAALFVLPVIALLTLGALDRWRDAKSVTRRFLLLRTHAELRQELVGRQSQIARRLHDLREYVAAADRSL